MTSLIDREQANGPTVPPCAGKSMIPADGKFSRIAAGLLLLSVTAGSSALADPVSRWTAASGLKPNEIEHPYQLLLTGGAPEPVLESGLLTISTASIAQNAFYMQLEPTVETARAFTLEFELRVVSGSTITDARGPMMVFVTIGDSLGTLLVIDVDRIAFVTSPGAAGTPANVDTDEAIHSYRLEHDGEGNFALNYDDGEDPLLVASAYSSTGAHGSLKRIGWGEGSINADGVLEIQAVTHDALGQIFEDSFELENP